MNKIKDLRLRLNIPYKEFSEILNISEATLVKLEKKEEIDERYKKTLFLLNNIYMQFKSEWPNKIYYYVAILIKYEINKEKIFKDFDKLPSLATIRSEINRISFMDWKKNKWIFCNNCKCVYDINDRTLVYSKNDIMTHSFYGKSVPEEVVQIYTQEDTNLNPYNGDEAFHIHGAFVGERVFKHNIFSLSNSILIVNKDLDLFRIIQKIYLLHTKNNLNAIFDTLHVIKELNDKVILNNINFDF